MNVYEKLLKCRFELQNKNLKKTGHNKFANYYYYDLGDFLKEIVVLSEKYKILTLFNTTSDLATLTIKDIEKEDSITFSAPFKTPTIKGANEVQNLGGAITYLRRYLFITAFEIVEHDTFDATTTTQNNKKPEIKNTPPVTKKTIHGLCTFCKGYLYIDKTQKKLFCENWADKKPHTLLTYAGQPELPESILKLEVAEAKKEAELFYYNYYSNQRCLIPENESDIPF